MPFGKMVVVKLVIGDYREDKKDFIENFVPQDVISYLDLPIRGASPYSQRPSVEKGPKTQFLENKVKKGFFDLGV